MRDFILRLPKGRSFPGKVLLTRLTDPLDNSGLHGSPRESERSPAENDVGPSQEGESSEKDQSPDTNSPITNSHQNKTYTAASNVDNNLRDSQKSMVSTTAADSARVMKFKKELATPTVNLDFVGLSKCVASIMDREAAGSGLEWCASYMRPTIWRLLLGYAQPNSDRREGVLRRKRIEYLDSVAQYYDIPDSERSEDEVNMLRQIVVGTKAFDITSSFQDSVAPSVILRTSSQSQCKTPWRIVSASAIK